MVGRRRFWWALTLLLAPLSWSVFNGGIALFPFDGQGHPHPSAGHITEESDALFEGFRLEEDLPERGLSMSLFAKRVDRRGGALGRRVLHFGLQSRLHLRDVELRFARNGRVVSRLLAKEASLRPEGPDLHCMGHVRLYRGMSLFLRSSELTYRPESSCFETFSTCQILSPHGQVLSTRGFRSPIEIEGRFRLIDQGPSRPQAEVLP